jgi:N-acetylneuraminate epimerase
LLKFRRCIIYKMSKRIFLLFNIIMLVAAGTTGQVKFTWTHLPSIPDSIGYAGSFAGVADNALIVAGGSNFPDGGAPWTGSVKHWYDKIFVLEKPNGTWKEAGRLPFALGYGVSISTPQGLILIGGSNSTSHHADVFLLQYRNGEIITEKLSSLPFALANTCGALVGNTIFVAGGLSAPDSKNSEKAFLCLDLSKKDAGWKLLPAWPGPSRMLSIAGSDGKQFYLFSGTELTNGSRTYLSDAYVFSEKSGWKKLPDLPQPAVAAPTPAFYKNAFYIFGGDTGKDAAKAAELKEKHPGFSDSILCFDIQQNNWSLAGKISYPPPVTTSLVVWNNKIVLPGGEVRPAKRTPQVLMAEFHDQ